MQKKNFCFTKEDYKIIKNFIIKEKNTSSQLARKHINLIEQQNKPKMKKFSKVN